MRREALLALVVVLTLVVVLIHALFGVGFEDRVELVAGVVVTVLAFLPEFLDDVFEFLAFHALFGVGFEDLVELVTDGSALFEDGDADGEISEQEREDGPMATGEVHPSHAEADREEKEEAGTSDSVSGCGSESSVGWLLLPIGLFGRRRPSER